MKRYLYDYGLPFSKHLTEEFLDPIGRKVAGRGAACFVIDGASGNGKTTFAVHIADYFEGAPISLEKDNHPQLSMGGGTFIANALKCHEQGKKVIIYDEAGDFSKYATMTKFNRMLNEFFEKYRYTKLIVIICLPNFNDLDAGLFNKGLVRGLLHCNDATRNQTSFTAFDMDEIGYLRKRMKDYPFHTSKAYWYVEYFSKGHFLDLPPERARQLEELSSSDKAESIKNKLLRKSDLLTYDEIARKLGVTKSWVGANVRKHRLEADDVEGRVLLFSDHVVKELKKVLKLKRKKTRVKK